MEVEAQAPPNTERSGPNVPDPVPDPNPASEEAPPENAAQDHHDHELQEAPENEAPALSDTVPDQRVPPPYQIPISSLPKELGRLDLGRHITRGVKFSPDGLCLLSNAEDNRLRILETPAEDAAWTPAVVMKEGELVYDFAWFPNMNSSDPSTCCLATTSQYQPIHLYDAYDGSIRGTYRCYNHLDEVEAARSVAFDTLGEKLYAGMRNEVAHTDEQENTCD